MLFLSKTAIINPYQRSTADLEAAVQSLYLKGLTLSEISKSWKDFLSDLKERGIDHHLCLVRVQRNICKAVRKGDRAEICDGFKSDYAAPTSWTSSRKR